MRFHAVGRAGRLPYTHCQSMLLIYFYHLTHVLITYSEPTEMHSGGVQTTRRRPIIPWLVSFLLVDSRVYATPGINAAPGIRRQSAGRRGLLSSQAPPLADAFSASSLQSASEQHLVWVGRDPCFSQIRTVFVETLDEAKHCPAQHGQSHYTV